MSNQPIYYRLRIRNANDTADAVTITSVRGGTNPYLSSAPSGDGASFDPLTAESIFGAYTGKIADWSIGSMQRAVTSQLEDAGFRQQLGYRKATLEWSYNGTTWSGGTSGGVLIAGYLTLLRLVNGAEFEYTVSDPMSALVSSTLFSPASTTSVASFLSAWPTRGCILGGPVMAPPVSGRAGSFIKIDDLGGWTMRVEAASGGQYYLRPINVYGPANSWKSATQISDDLASAINEAVAPFQGALTNGAQSPWTTVGDIQGNYWAWAGLTVLIDSGSGFVPWKPLSYFSGPLADAQGNLLPIPIVSPAKGSQGTGLRVLSDGTRTLTNGATVRVRVITILPTDACPIYLSDHPVAILTTLFTAVGFAYNSASATALTTLIGADARYTKAITSSAQLSDIVSEVCRMWGIGIRGDDAGAFYLFNGRDTTRNAAPSTTVTTADVVSGSTSLPFELDAGRALKTLTVSQKRFVDVRSAPFGAKNSIVDGVATGDDQTTFIDDDPGSVALGQLDLSGDGMLHTASVLYPVIADFMKATARAIFDRFGRGPLALETTLLRGGVGDGLNLGDEALVQLPELPNHNYRLGDNPAIAARRMQIVRRTVTPKGYAVRFLDSGPNTQPLGTVPVVSIAASTDTPRSAVSVTITNAATLNGLGYGARLQMAITTGGAPSASQYTDVRAWSATEGVPTSAITIAAIAAGATVYVRARSEKPGSSPSNYGTAASVTLATLNDPTSVTATPSVSDGSLCALSWTPGSGTSADVVDIWLRLSGAAFSTAAKVDTVAAGSVVYTISGLAPGIAYTASVQYRDPGTQDISDPVDVTFTAGAVTRTLTAPVSAVGFSGSLDPLGVPRKDGVYGIAVVAAELPGLVEVAIATETSVGSGTYGSFVTSSNKVASVSGAWTIASFVAPNDDLRRQLKARHVRDGTTPSSYTAVVTVTPWTPQALPGYPTALICQVTMLSPSPSSDAGVNARFQVTGIDPTGATTPQVEIVSLSPGLSVVSGAAVGTPASNNSTWKVALGAPGSGPGTIIARALSALNYADQVIAVPEQTTLANPQGTVSVDANGSWSFTVDGPANTLSFKYATSTSAFPSDATAAAGTVIGSSARTATVTGGGTLAFGATIYITVIPYTGASGTGTALPSIRLRGSYQSYSATKTVAFSRSSFVRTYTTGTPGAVLYDSNASPQNPTMASGDLIYLRMMIELPVGVTLSSASFDGVWNTATTQLISFPVAFYKGNTLNNSGFFTYGGGAQTVTFSLSGTVGTNEALLLHAQWTGALSGTADAAQATVKDVYVTYSMPTPDKTI